MKSSPKLRAASPDVVVLGGPTEDGVGLKVLRARNDRVEIGEVRPLQEGKPLTGDVVTLKPRAEAPWLCDVEVAHAAATPSESAQKGPAQVATKAYRKNWESIFGPANDVSAMN